MIENPQFKVAFDGASDIVQRLYDTEVHRFDRRARNSFYLHRATGIGVIVLSASLPFLSGLEEDLARTYLVPGVAFAISALSSLVAFMAYGDSWRGYRSAEIRTRYAHLKWESRILDAKLANEIGEGLKIIKEATAHFLQDMDGIASAETRGFFQRIQERQSALRGPQT